MGNIARLCGAVAKGLVSEGLLVKDVGADAALCCRLTGRANGVLDHYGLVSIGLVDAARALQGCLTVLGQVIAAAVGSSQGNSGDIGGYIGAPGNARAVG